MIIRFNVTEYELKVLKAALKSYPKNKNITTDLLNLIEYQENEQRTDKK